MGNTDFGQSELVVLPEIKSFLDLMGQFLPGFVDLPAQ
jgi:hypothetical protein